MSSWVAVDADGSEWVFSGKPFRSEVIDMFKIDGRCVKLPKGSIKALIGRELSWSDEAAELKEIKE